MHPRQKISKILLTKIQKYKWYSLLSSCSCIILFFLIVSIDCGAAVRGFPLPFLGIWFTVKLQIWTQCSSSSSADILVHRPILHALIQVDSL